MFRQKYSNLNAWPTISLQKRKNNTLLKLRSKKFVLFIHEKPYPVEIRVKQNLNRNHSIPTERPVCVRKRDIKNCKTYHNDHSS